MVEAVRRAEPDPERFNPAVVMPYQLRQADFALAMQDVYDLLYDINTTLVSKDLPRLEETVRGAIFSGALSDILTASMAKHARVLAVNRHHNGHPDLIPRGRYPNDDVAAGEEGVEVKTTKGGPSVDAHGARNAWVCVFRYTLDEETEPSSARAPTRITGVWLANLTLEDFRHNERGLLGTRTASPNRQGVQKLRTNWVYLEPR